jgi:hypothetical protein
MELKATELKIGRMGLLVVQAHPLHKFLQSYELCCELHKQCRLHSFYIMLPME